MVFGRFLGMMRRIQSMSCRNVSVVCGLLGASGFVMLRCFAMVFRGVLVMFSRRLMMFCALVSCHFVSSSLAGFFERGHDTPNPISAWREGQQVALVSQRLTPAGTEAEHFALRGSTMLHWVAEWIAFGKGAIDANNGHSNENHL
jgi:hypothetical protein